MVADDAAARTDVPAWCRMRGQESSGGRRPAGRPATGCGGQLSDSRRPAGAAGVGVRKSRSPRGQRAGVRRDLGGRRVAVRARATRATNCSRVKAYSCVPTVSTTYAASTQPTCAPARARPPRPSRPGSRRGRRRRRRWARPSGRRRAPHDDRRLALRAHDRRRSAPRVVTWVPTRSQHLVGRPAGLLLDQCDSYSLENRMVAPSISSRIRSRPLTASCWLGSAMNG